jgi:hypothetical protein
LARTPKFQEASARRRQLLSQQVRRYLSTIPTLTTKFRTNRGDWKTRDICLAAGVAERFLRRAFASLGGSGGDGKPLGQLIGMTKKCWSEGTAAGAWTNRTDCDLS